MSEVNVSVVLLEVFGVAMAPKSWHGVGMGAGDGGVASQAITMVELPVRSGRKLVRSAGTVVQSKASIGAQKESIWYLWGKRRLTRQWVVAILTVCC